MMLWCSKCYRAIRVVQEGPLAGKDSEFWPDKYPCYSCYAPMAGDSPSYDLEILKKYHVMDMTDEELFQYLTGLGTPPETQCSSQKIKTLFSQDSVESVELIENEDNTRCVLDSISFKSGAKIYLGASPQGAVVYRISVPDKLKELICSSKKQEI